MLSLLSRVLLAKASSHGELVVLSLVDLNASLFGGGFAREVGLDLGQGGLDHARKELFRVELSVELQLLLLLCPQGLARRLLLLLHREDVLNLPDLLRLEHLGWEDLLLVEGDEPRVRFGLKLPDAGEHVGEGLLK